jgi:gluconokinase
MGGIAQIVVMGVSASGKSTIAARLAERLGCEMADGDAFHPAANVAKMAAGIPLEDEDRWPWLAAVAAWIAEREGAGRTAVIACSALKRAYRDVLRAASPRVVFMYLAVAREAVEERVRARKGHFMPERLVASQYGALEPLAPDERGVTVDAGAGIEDVVARALAALTSLGISPVGGDAPTA